MRNNVLPQKLRWNLKITKIEKEIHLPNLHVWFHVSFRWCITGLTMSLFAKLNCLGQFGRFPSFHDLQWDQLRGLEITPQLYNPGIYSRKTYKGLSQMTLLTLPETNSSPLKINGSKMRCPFGLTVEVMVCFYSLSSYVYSQNTGSSSSVDMTSSLWKLSHCRKSAVPSCILHSRSRLQNSTVGYFTLQKTSLLFTPNQHGTSTPR